MEDRLIKQLESVREEVLSQLSKLTDAHNGLRVDVQNLAGRIAPLEQDIHKKASEEAFSALERRVSKLEENPKNTRDQLGLLISASGCLSGLIFSALGTGLTILFFVVQHWGK